MRYMTEQHKRRIAILERRYGKPIKTILEEHVPNIKVTNAEFAKQLGISGASLTDWFLRYKVKGRGSGNGFRTPEHIAKVRKAAIGSVHTIEHIEKVRQANLKTGFWKQLGHAHERKGYRWIKTRHGGGNNCYEAEHRVIMSRHLNRTLLSTEHVHHLDGDTLNNKLENLYLVSKNEHWLLNRLLRCIDKDFAEAIVKTLTQRFPNLGR